MTAQQVAEHLWGSDLRKRKVGKDKWRGKCPVHGGNSLEVSVGKKHPVAMQCWGGCEPAAILKVAGLPWGALFDSKPRTKQEKAAFLKAKAERERERVAEERSRYREQIALMRRDGYTASHMARDWEVCIAVAQIMAVDGEKPHLVSLLEWHSHRVLIGSMTFKFNPWHSLSPSTTSSVSPTQKPPEPWTREWWDGCMSRSDRMPKEG